MHGSQSLSKPVSTASMATSCGDSFVSSESESVNDHDESNCSHQPKQPNQNNPLMKPHQIVIQARLIGASSALLAELPALGATLLLGLGSGLGSGFERRGVGG